MSHVSVYVSNCIASDIGSQHEPAVKPLSMSTNRPVQLLAVIVGIVMPAYHHQAPGGLHCADFREASASLAGCAGARATTKEHTPTEMAAHFAYCAWHGLVVTWLRTSITPPALCHATSTYILQLIQTVMQGDAQNWWHTGLCWLGSHDRQACLVYACHDSGIDLAQDLASGRWGVAWMSWFFAVVCSGMAPIRGNAAPVAACPDTSFDMVQIRDRLTLRDAWR